MFMLPRVAAYIEKLSKARIHAALYFKTLPDHVRVTLLTLQATATGIYTQALVKKVVENNKKRKTIAEAENKSEQQSSRSSKKRRIVGGERKKRKSVGAEAGPSGKKRKLGAEAEGRAEPARKFDGNALLNMVILTVGRAKVGEAEMSE